MIELLLAATILGSIPSAVEKTLQDPVLERAVLQMVTEEQKALADRVERNEKIRDQTISCAVESLIGAGTDIGLTSVARERCPECGEANPLGTSAETRTGLKFVQLGTELGLCLFDAKHRNNTKEPGHEHGKWISRVLRWGVVANNLYTVATGKPLVKWGIGDRAALAK